MTPPNQEDSAFADFPLPIGPGEVVSAKELALRMKDLSPVAARKAISRAAKKEILWRSEHLQLPGGGRLYARHLFAGQERFLQHVRPLLAKRPGIARVLDEMLRSPAVHQDSVAKLLAATLDPAKYPEQRSLDDEFLVLAELGIGKIDTFGVNDRPASRKMRVQGIQKMALACYYLVQSLNRQRTTPSIQPLQENLSRMLTHNRYRLRHFLAKLKYHQLNRL